MSETRIYLDNTYMDVIQFGSGKKNLVIVSGISLLGLEGLGNNIAKQYSAFENDYTVYVIDRKKDLPVGYHVTDMADDVYRLLRELEVDSAAFCGMSQGGAVCISLALEHPEIVEKLILISAFARSTPLMKANGLRWLELAKARKIPEVLADMYDANYTEALSSRLKSSLEDVLRKVTDEDAERLEVLAKACTNVDYLDDLSMIRCPVLVIADKNDKTVGPEGSFEIADALNCELVMFDQYSHAVYDEGAPEVHKKMIAFLKKKK